MNLRDHLAALKEHGARRAKIEFAVTGEVTALEVELGADVEPVAKFVDREGNPVNLDDGAPDLTSDPIRAKYETKPSS